MAVGQNPVSLVNIKKRRYMGVHPPQNGGIGFDPYPYPYGKPIARGEASQHAKAK